MPRPRVAHHTPGKSQRNGSWRIYWRDGRDIRQITVGQVDAGTAELRRLEVAVALRTGDWPEWAQDSPAVRTIAAGGPKGDDDALDAYGRELRASVTPGWASTSLKHLTKLAVFAGRPLLDVTPRQADAFLAQLGRSNKTRNNIRDEAGRFYRWAVRTRRCRHNPFAGIARLRVPDVESIIHLSREQRNVVLKAAKGPHELAVWIALYAGLRRGEIARCRWEHISLTRRKLEVPRTKTGKRRTVDIAAPLLKKLAAVPDAQRVGNVIHWPDDHEGWIYCADELLKRVATNAKDVPADHIRWNVFRHTFASLLVQAGVSIYKVSQWMGNSIEVCMKHYASMSPDHDSDIDRL